jgi:hypothetical protein
VTSSVDTRLRQLALLRRRRISHLLDDLLDQALPTTEDLAAQFIHLASATPATPELPPQPPPARALQPAGTGSAITSIPRTARTPAR